jgi:hypothetical protein
MTKYQSAWVVVSDGEGWPIFYLEFTEKAWAHIMERASHLLNLEIEYPNACLRSLGKGGIASNLTDEHVLAIVQQVRGTFLKV